MTAENTHTTATAEREITLTRHLDAPRELVWRAFTQPEHLVQWWGPKGFTNTFHEIDVRPGGVWRFVMHGPDGTDYDNNVIFEELVEPERIAFRHTADDGTEHHATDVTFTPDGNGTLVTLHLLFPTPEARDYVVEHFGAIERGYETLDHLAAYLARM